MFYCRSYEASLAGDLTSLALCWVDGVEETNIWIIESTLILPSLKTSMQSPFFTSLLLVNLLLGQGGKFWLGLIRLFILAGRSEIHSSSSKQMSSSCWEENTAACSCTASLAPRAAGKGPACGPVVFHICLRSPVTLDSWEGCDSSHYSPAHISHLNWEGKWPSLPFSLDAALGRRGTLTRSLELSSSPLSGPSLSCAAARTQRLMLVISCFVCFFFFFHIL